MPLILSIIGLGVLIFVHELGHFLAAKSVGIGVPRFSIGFGPTTPLRFRRGETEYVLSWIPLGGYVKMASREEQEAMAGLEGGELTQDYPPHKLFENKPLWARIMVISAGVIMNALFAWATYAVITYAYGRVVDPTTTVSRVVADALPAAAAPLAELPRGSRITAVNGEAVTSWNDIMSEVMDPRSPRLSFALAGQSAPVVVDVPGTESETRAAILGALVPLWPPRVGTTVPGTPADKAGLKPGDLVTAIDGEPIAAWDELVGKVEPSAGRELVLTVERDGAELTVPVVPEAMAQEVPGGESRQVGRIGITPQLDQRRERYGLWGSIVDGGRRTWEITSTVLFALKGMFTGQISPKELGGPIMIVQTSTQFASLGWIELVSFMAFLSINLAVLNLLPIPVLDGGHLVFLFIEGIRGRPLGVDIRMRLTQVGLFLILGLMVFVIGNDLWRQFGG